MRTALLMLMLMLGACSFQLRGAVQVPPELQQLHLESRNDDDTPLLRSLGRHLATAGVALLDAGTPGGYRLLLDPERVDSRAVSVDRSARSAERELSVKVRAVLQNEAGKVVYGPMEVKASKIYRYDSNSVIAKEDEELRIRGELRESLSRQLLRALQAAGRSLPKDPGTAG